ncbi:MAG: hypothetical protein AB8F34_03245 [Akkermansiaceae bacterium]
MGNSESFGILSKDDGEILKKIEGGMYGSGYYVIRLGAFGLAGQVIAKAPLGTAPQKLEELLVKANRKFAATEKQKITKSTLPLE